MATAFRLLGSQDIDGLLFNLRRWHQEARERFDAITATAAMGRLLRDAQHGHVWMIEHGEDAVGYVVMTFQNAPLTFEPRAYVAALYLTPSHRGRGIGRQAVRFLEDVGHLLRVRVHHFGTESERKHALFIYRRPALGSSAREAGNREVAL